jgi:hypothetical protein
MSKNARTEGLELPTRPSDGAWADFFSLRDKARVPADFMNERPMNAPHGSIVATPDTAPSVAVGVPVIKSWDE